MKKEPPTVEGFAFVKQAGRWPYRLTQWCWFRFPGENFGHYNLYDAKGRLWAKVRGDRWGVAPDYAWDGCTGVPDFAATLAAALWHDIAGQFRHLECVRKHLSWWKWNRLFADLIRAARAPVVAATYHAGLVVLNPAYQLLGSLFGKKPEGSCKPVNNSL